MNLRTPEEKEAQDIRIRVMAAMETGNFQEARTLMKEYRAVNKPKADALRSDVAATYGVFL